MHLRDQGARHDLVDAVFALGGDDLLDDRPPRRGPRAFPRDRGRRDFLTGTKRAINILRIEEKKDKTTYDEAPDPKLFKRPEEKALAKAVDEVEKAAAAAVAREDFEAAMTRMARLRKPLASCSIMSRSTRRSLSLRGNRLRLLNRIRATTLTVADFSKIEG